MAKATNTGARLVQGERFRGVFEPCQAQRQAERAQDGAAQERDAPAPGVHCLGPERAVQGGDQQRSDQRARHGADEAQAGADAAMAVWAALAEIDHGDRELATDRDALDHAQKDQRCRGERPDAGVGGQQADGDRGYRHRQHRDQQGHAPPYAIADMAEQHAAERARDEGNGEYAVGGQQRQQVVVEGKEVPGETSGQEAVGGEVVPLQHVADAAGQLRQYRAGACWQHPYRFRHHEPPECAPALAALRLTISTGGACYGYGWAVKGFAAGAKRCR